MTSLDPTPIIRTLREEVRHLGQYRPETVNRLIAATERTAQWPLPHYRPSPMPRGGRTSWPADRNAVVVPFRSNECAQKHPDRGLLCGEPAGHHGSHVAYGLDDRIIDEWPDTPEVGV